MIKESDIKAGNVLRYLGGAEEFDKYFSAGINYIVKVDKYNYLFVESIHETIVEIEENDYDLWELVSTAATEEPSKSSNQISLTLTQDEAQVLADVLSCIGGDPEYSRRKFTKSVADKLEHFGITHMSRYDYEEVSFDMGGTINFTKSVKETVEYNGSTYDKDEFDMMLEKLEKL